jgi:hypothetical protein
MSNLPTNINDTTSTLDPILDHAQMHNQENVLINVHDGKLVDVPVTVGTSIATAIGNASTAPIPESQVTGLVGDLLLKAPLSSPALTGIPTAPTAATGTSTTQIATTAFVQGAASSITYTNASPTPQAVGGIPVGKTFTNESITQVFNELLYPYQNPYFTDFHINSQASTVEVGTTLPTSETFTWASANSSNVTPSSLAIRDNTTTLVSSLSPSGSQSVSIGTVQLTSPGSRTWTIQGTNTNSGTYSSTTTVTWDYFFYYGTSASTTLTAANIQALSRNLQGGFSGNYSYASGNYKYLAYPASSGPASAFTDTSTNLTVTMADSSDDPTYSNSANGYSYAIVSVTNSQSITTNYYVYRTKYVLGGSITIRVT